MDRIRLTITLKNDLLKRLDSIVDGTRIRNRSHAIEYLLSQSLAPKISQAVILAGGKGIKMRPLTHEIPTALIPVHGKPALEYTIELLRENDVRDIIIAIGHLGTKIKDHFGNGNKFGVKITYSEESKLLGTAGAIANAQQLLEEKPFLVFHGDILVKLNLKEFILYHQQQENPVATIGLQTVPETAEYGMVTLQGNKILRFVEKPRKTESVSQLINTGIYLFEQSIFNYIGETRPLMLESIFPVLAKDRKLFGFSFGSPWYDISSPKRYEQALKEWN